MGKNFPAVTHQGLLARRACLTAGTTLVAWLEIVQLVRTLLEWSTNCQRQPLGGRSRERARIVLQRQRVSAKDQPTNLAIVATRPFTESTLFWKAAFSLGSKSSSMIRSTPPVPNTTGTPT